MQSTETFVGNKKINQGQDAEHRNICRIEIVIICRKHNNKRQGAEHRNICRK
jgi:hypothetical protein